MPLRHDGMIFWNILFHSQTKALCRSTTRRSPDHRGDRYR